MCTPDVSNNIMEPGTLIKCKVFLEMPIFTEPCGINDYTLHVMPKMYICPMPDGMPGIKICEYGESRRSISHKFSVNNDQFSN